MSKLDSSKFDIALVSNNKILETGTSNLVLSKMENYTLQKKIVILEIQ